MPEMMPKMPKMMKPPKEAEMPAKHEQPRGIKDQMANAMAKMKEKHPGMHTEHLHSGK